LIDALIIVALGMAIIFAVLGVLLGVMVLLNRFFKPSAAKDKQ
jgi:Na+-transporting methylmalonyl-CoA/oxaloacetate decarboxylase gamma subunit